MVPFFQEEPIGKNANMLWQKESVKKNALYVNICDFTENFILPWLTEPIKSTVEKSDATGKLAKKLFDKHQWNAAMNVYNQILCYAKPESQNISVAYSGRSACFYNMNMYKECLIDIELATKFGYPNDQMPELVQRKANCMKLIAEGEQLNDFVAKLDFEADKNCPSMANVLRIKQNGKKNYSLVAKEEIDVGKTILVEKAYISSIYSKHERKCNICLKGFVNLMPCKRCTVAMFCSDECQNHFLHKHECGMRYCENSTKNGLVMDNIRSILLAINLFSSVNELMEFVEKTIANDLKMVSLTDEQSKYELFLNLAPDASIMKIPGFKAILASQFKYLLSHPNIKTMFKTKKDQRFLMHLLCFHMQILQSNAMRVSSEFHIEYEQRENLYSLTGLVAELLKHSCAPNVLLIENDAELIAVVAQPIKKGETLVVSRLPFLLINSKENRQSLLQMARNFICKCTRCQGHFASKSQRKRFQSNPDYQYIETNYLSLDYNDAEKCQAMKDKCIAILKNCGGMLWCDEIGVIIFTFHQILCNHMKRDFRLDKISSSTNKFLATTSNVIFSYQSIPIVLIFWFAILIIMYLFL